MSGCQGGCGNCGDDCSPASTHIKATIGSLRTLRQRAQYRPFLAQWSKDRNIYHIGTLGPDGQMLCWKNGTKKILKLDPDMPEWLWKGTVGSDD